MVGICLLGLLCLLWGQPNQLSPGQTLGEGCTLSFPASFRLRGPFALASHSLSIPWWHNLDQEQRVGDCTLGASGVCNLEETQEKLSTLQRPHQSLEHPTLTFTAPVGHILRYWRLQRNRLPHSRSLLPEAMLLLHHPIPHPHHWVIGPGWTLGPRTFPMIVFIAEFQCSPLYLAQSRSLTNIS